MNNDGCGTTVTTDTIVTGTGAMLRWPVTKPVTVRDPYLLLRKSHGSRRRPLLPRWGRCG